MRTAAILSPQRNSYSVGDSIRQELNNLIDDLNYLGEHHLFISGAVAPGTNTAKVKTVTASISYMVQGDIKAKAATDDLWVLGVAGSNTNIAVGFFNKYLLYLDAAGVATVQEGVQAATAAGVTFAARPPVGKTVIAVMTVQNGSGAVFIPGATLLGAAGITTTFRNGVDKSMFYANTTDK